MATIRERQDKYRQVVREVLAENRIEDVREVFVALLITLEDNHWGNYIQGDQNIFRDGLHGFTGTHSVSHADSLRNLTAASAALNQANVDVERANDLETGPRESLVAHTSCIADILNAVLPEWNAEAQKSVELIATMPAHISPREGDPIDQPWEGKPLDLEGRPTDEPWDGKTQY